MITLIAATSVNGIIGLRGESGLLWRSKADMDWFELNTKNKIVVMGHNTYKSLEQPLKGRKTIVLSKKHPPGRMGEVIFYNSYANVIKAYSDFVVIGGESMYNLFLPIADEIALTTISIHINEDEESSFARFPISEMEKSFTMTGESAAIEDKDILNNNPITLIFTKWARAPGTLQ